MSDIIEIDLYNPSQDPFTERMRRRLLYGEKIVMANGSVIEFSGRPDESMRPMMDLLQIIREHPVVTEMTLITISGYPPESAELFTRDRIFWLLDDRSAWLLPQ